MATACLCGDLGDEEIGAVPVVAEEAKEDQASDAPLLPSAASSSLRQAGFAFKNARHQTAKVGAERNAATTTPSPARKRSISGSGDDAA
jgi:hypothetical protein